MQNILFTKSLSQAIRKTDSSAINERLKAISGDMLGLIGLTVWCLTWMYLLKLI